MSAEVISITQPVDARWQEYAAAAERAQRTRRVEDGIAAGRAWRRWLDLYMSPEQRQQLDRGPR